VRHNKKKLHTSSCKEHIILVRLESTGIFSTDFLKILKYQISSKPIQWEPSCSMQTDRQLDRH